MAILFITFAIAMAVGTFVENDYDTDTARIWVYNTWWFEAIMGLFVVNFIGNISRYRLLKKENWAVLVLHLSWVFIIVGAGVTRYFGNEGMISLREGETSINSIFTRVVLSRNKNQPALVIENRSSLLTITVPIEREASKSIFTA